MVHREAADGTGLRSTDGEKDEGGGGAQPPGDPGLGLHATVPFPKRTFWPLGLSEGIYVNVNLLDEGQMILAG